MAGVGYAYHDPATSLWILHDPSAEHDEVIDFVAGIENTLLKAPPEARRVGLGQYLIAPRVTGSFPPRNGTKAMA